MSKNKAIFLMVLASIFWSIAGLFIKQIPWHPIIIASLRSLIAGLFITLVFIKKKKHFTKKVFWGSISYIFVAGFFVTANKLTTTTNAILLQFTSPIWVLVISTLFLKKRPKLRDLAVIITVMFGMILFFLGDLKLGNIIGNIIAICAGIALAIMILIMNSDESVDTALITILGNFFLFFITLPYIILHPPVFTFTSVSNIIILGVLQLGMGYVLFTIGVKYVSSLEASLIMVVEPLFSPIWVFLFIGEKPSIYAVFGGIIVVVAIVTYQITTKEEKTV